MSAPHFWDRVHKTVGSSLWKCRTCGSMARSSEDGRPDALLRRNPVPEAVVPYSSVLVEDPSGLTCDEIVVHGVQSS